jgi:flagellar biosynthesis/type III secretory pathway protein FliH
MLLPFASNPKKRQLFSYIKNNKDLLDKILANIYEYLYFVDKDNYIKYIGEPPMNKKFVTLELPESLVKQYEKRGWEKGLLQGKQEGWEKGLLQGKQEGWEKGKQEGWEKGKQEGEYKKAITTVIKMYKKGYSLIEISEIIDLPISKVKEILRLN